MRNLKTTPQGVTSTARPLLATTAIAAMLLLSACGSSTEKAASTTPDSPSASSSTGASATASATSASPTATKSPSSSVTPSPRATPSASASAQDREGDVLAQAPELGMPPAKQFDPNDPAGSTGAGGVCTPAQLSGSLSPTQGAAGSVLTTITLTNTGPSPCVLNGFPGVSFVDGQGNPVGAPASRDASAGGGGVTLAPGASASAGLKITQSGVIGQVCNPHPAAGLRVYPPGSYDSMIINYPAQACGNPKVEQLQVKGFGS